MMQSVGAGETARLVDDNLLFMRWMYDLPTWLLGLLVVGIFVLVSLLYGLLLGLLTVATWGSFTQASSLASQEASSIAVLYRDLGGYPQPLKTRLQGDLRAHTDFIIRKAWPAQRLGFIYENNYLTRFQQGLLTFEPQTTGQQVLHGETIQAFNRLVDIRRQRIESVKGSVPGVLWSVVLLGALATIVFSYLFQVENLRLHALLTGILAGMIGLLVFLILTLDHPYWGEVSISADAYQLVLDRVMNNNLAITAVD